jgi:DNA-binding transcriptional LysR family regulator
MRGATLRQLRAFSLVATRRSFVQAAAELHLTPSAVSLQIKELEQSVGLPLFVRHAKALALTRAGELLLADVRRALVALQDADDTLARLHGQEACAVSIGMVSNARYFLPGLLARFREEHRDIALHLSVANREQLVGQLRHGQVDLAVMGTPPRELEARADPFATQPLGIVASPAHPLAGERAVPVSALTNEEFVVREPGSGTRAAMDRFFRDARVEPQRVMEMNCNEAIKQAVMASMGMAFVSLPTAGFELQEQLLLAIDVVGLPVMRRWFVVTMDFARVTAAAETLRRFILDRGALLIAQQFGAAQDPPPVAVVSVAAPEHLQ